MHLRASRAVAALAVLPLSSGALALLPGAVGGTASAACAPSVAVRTTASQATKQADVHPAKAVVSKKHKRKYVAHATLTVTQASATVSLTQSVCPDGASGVAASTTQTASGTGVATKTVSAKGHSKKAVKKALKRKEKKAIAKLRKHGASETARAQAVARAVAAARPIAASKAHDALYLSDLVYVSVDAAGNFRLTATPPAGRTAETMGQAPDGDLTLSVPAGFDPGAMTVAFPCVRRAPAWPTSYFFDGGSASSPRLQAFAAQGSAPAGVTALVLSGVADHVAPSSPTVAESQQWFARWGRASATDPTVTYEDGLSAGQTAFAGGLVCLAPSVAEPGAYSVTLHGAHVGTALSAPDRNADVHVVRGLPVRLR